MEHHCIYKHFSGCAFLLGKASHRAVWVSVRMYRNVHKGTTYEWGVLSAWKIIKHVGVRTSDAMVKIMVLSPQSGIPADIYAHTPNNRSTSTLLPLHFTHCAAHRAPPSTRLSACWAVPARGSNRQNSCFSTTVSNSACVRAHPVSKGHSQYQMSTMRPFEEAVAQKQADSPGDTPQCIPAPREC